ncbi:ABC transporter permease [candidate division KSB1 bacterium]
MNRDILPPKLASWIIRRFSNQYLKGPALGDLEEIYFQMVEEEGAGAAKRWYRLQAMKSLKYIYKNTVYRSTGMFRNYLKIAIRNLKRNKGFSLINISGLTLGITCFILLMMFIQYEYSFDQFHKNADNIYRVVYKSSYSYQDKNHWACSTAALAPALIEEFPEVKAACTINIFTINALMQYNDYEAFESGIYADHNFSRVFDFPVISGDKYNSLSKPNSIMLSESLARKIFRDNEPIGEVIKLRGSTDITVTGVFEDLPGNTHLQFDYIVSYCSDPDYERRVREWTWNDNHTYLILDEDQDIAEFEKKLNDLHARHLDIKRSGQTRYLQPLSDIHFESQYNYNIAIVTDRKYIYMLSITSFLILLIACINFINLSTAKSSKRAKEIGIRKTVGAKRNQLINQYFGESMLLVIMSFILALIMVFLILPFYNGLIERDISFEFLQTPSLLIILASAFIVTGILSGIYPSIYLSAFKPVNTFKGILRTEKKNMNLRNILVLFQFSISILLIVCTVIVYGQLHYIKNKDIGYNRENIVVIPVRDSGIRDNHLVIKETLLRNPDIKKVSCSGTLPIMRYGGQGQTFKDDNGNEVDFILAPGIGDFDFIDLFEIEVSEGRKFSKEYGADQAESVLLNETAVEKLGWKDPVGKEFDLDFYGRRGKAKVIGIIKDLHFWSLHAEVIPYALFIDLNTVSYISIKISPGNIPDTISYIENTYNDFKTTYPFDYFFLDDKFNQNYQSEEKFGTVFSYFSGLAIFIACLGLFGLTAFMIEQKTKEIGIRKVLGGNELKIVILLSGEFTRLIIVSNIFAWPAAYFLISRWLENFAYKINMGAGIFILSGSLALFIAMVTIGYQTFKAAHANPVDSLRYE